MITLRAVCVEGGFLVMQDGQEQRQEFAPGLVEALDGWSRKYGAYVESLEGEKIRRELNRDEINMMRGREGPRSD